jgi:hypothetical protein
MIALECTYITVPMEAIKIRQDLSTIIGNDSYLLAGG